MDGCLFKRISRILEQSHAGYAVICAERLQEVDPRRNRHIAYVSPRAHKLLSTFSEQVKMGGSRSSS